MGTTNTPTRKVDWSLAPRGTVSGVIEATAGTLAAGAIGATLGWDPVWAAAAGVLGALSHLTVSALHAKHTPGAILYRLGCWAGAGSWLAWTFDAHQHWSSDGHLASLAVGATVAGIMSPLANQTRDKAGPGRTLMLRAEARAAEEWRDRFRRVCRVPVEVTDVRPWPTGGGFDVCGRIPPEAGATLRQLQARVEALATDADLPDGCGIEIERDGTRAKFVAHVSTVNRLVEDIDYPEDFSPTSIYDDMPVGELRDSRPALINLRENSAVVVGQKRSGKTNTLDVMTCGTARARDALVCHIDMNGGGISQLWLTPWLEGRTKRPALLWSASTPMEALYLTTVLLAIAKHRKTAYRKFKASSDSKLLQLSEDLPEVVTYVDEGAESMGIGANKDPILRQVRDNLEELQRIGGNEGMNVVPSALRATNDMISQAVIKMSRIRIGMLVQDPEELAYLYGWQHKDSIDPADLAGQGSGFISTGAETPRPFKAYRMKPKQIIRAAEVIARQRPELDAASAAVADGEFELDLGGRKPVKVSGLYSGRLERMRAAFTGDADDEPGTDVAVPEPDDVAVPTAPVTVPASFGRPDLRLVPDVLADAAAWPSISDLRASQAPPVDLSDATNWPRFGTPPEQSASPEGEVRQITGPRRPVPEILIRELAIFDDAGVDRMHSESLAQALGLRSIDELTRLMLPLGIRTLPEAFIVSGRRARGYARETIEAAAESIARGEIDVPPAVTDWPATKSVS